MVEMGPRGNGFSHEASARKLSAIGRRCRRTRGTALIGLKPFRAL